MTQISKEKLAELLAKARSQKQQASATIEPQKTKLSEAIDNLPNTSHSTDRYGKEIIYNKEQQEFISIVTSGSSAILIGAAGTGKTTCMRGAITSLIQSGRAGILYSESHKYLPLSGSPGIVAVSFTRRAVANLRKAMPSGMEDNCITIHKLLEYEPVYYTVIDEISGEEKQTMKFEPTRNAFRTLPDSIRTVIIDEASMVSVELFKQLQDALPHIPQYIFLGDVQQLPPVFGSAILGYKMLELKTVELTQVYRQALESPIIRLAHRILSGNPINSKEFPDWKHPNQLTIHPWKKKLHADIGLLTAAKFFTAAITDGAYNPEEDIILIPFNKSFGTDELNKHIAQYLAVANQRPVYEVIAGFNKVYFSVGDKVLYDKEDAVIISIAKNGSYAGKQPQKESLTLDYWGHNSEKKSVETSESVADVDFLLEQAASLTGEKEDRVRVASHVITVQMLDTNKEVVLDTASEINSLIMGYALTVHKSQGSEWRKVFLVFHQSHATMLQRELLYTAVTRAREELYVICEPESFVNGIKSQRIKGNTLAEKAEYFKGKVDNGEYKLS